MDALFVVNPAAGHGRGAARWESARALAAPVWGRVEVRVTERPGHGRELARAAAAAGVGVVVAVGGDGTLGEVVDGVLAAGSAACAATFPAGSGCDFARHAGVPRDPAAWARAMRSARPRRLDAARAEFVGRDGARRERHFLNVAALGLAGEVAVGVERRGKAFGGTLTYLIEGLRAIAAAKARRLRLVVDGVPEDGDFHMVAVANTSTIGGGMKLVPDADAEDGLLDLLTVGDLPRATLLRLMPSIYSGGHLGAEGVTLRRARRVEVLGDGDWPLNIDGDLDGRAPAVFEVLPKAVPFLL